MPGTQPTRTDLSPSDNGPVCTDVASADADFITHAPADIAWLLDKVEANHTDKDQQA